MKQLKNVWYGSHHFQKSVNRFSLSFPSITIVPFWDWGGLGGQGTTQFYFSFYFYVGRVFHGVK